MKNWLIAFAFLAATGMLVFGGPQSARSATIVNQIAGTGTIELYRGGPTGANFFNASTTAFNQSSIGPLPTFLPNVFIDPAGTSIVGGMQYDVDLRSPPGPDANKEIREPTGNLIGIFAFENLSATVLDATPSTITFTASEHLESQSGTDWDFSPFANPGASLTINFTYDPSRGISLQDFFAGTATDPHGNPVFVLVGEYQFEQIAVPVPEPSALTLGALGALALVLFHRRPRVY